MQAHTCHLSQSSEHLASSEKAKFNSNNSQLLPWIPIMCSRINTLSAKIFRASRSCWTPSPCKTTYKMLACTYGISLLYTDVHNVALQASRFHTANIDPAIFFLLKHKKVASLWWQERHLYKKLERNMRQRYLIINPHPSIPAVLEKFWFISKILTWLLLP